MISYSELYSFSPSAVVSILLMPFPQFVCICQHLTIPPPPLATGIFFKQTKFTGIANFLFGETSHVTSCQLHLFGFPNMATATMKD